MIRKIVISCKRLLPLGQNTKCFTSVIILSQYVYIIHKHVRICNNFIHTFSIKFRPMIFYETNVMELKNLVVLEMPHATWRCSPKSSEMLALSKKIWNNAFLQKEVCKRHYTFRCYWLRGGICGTQEQPFAVPLKSEFNCLKGGTAPTYEIKKKIILDHFF